MTYEAASTIPLGLATAALGMYNVRNPNNSAGLFPPWKPSGRDRYLGKPFVVLGGSASVGHYGERKVCCDSRKLMVRALVIQLAKLSGFSPIITTASPHNAPSLLALGATHVLDRRLPHKALYAQIAHLAGQPINTIYDAVSVPDTQNLGYDLLASGGCLVLVLQDTIEEDRKTRDKRIVTVDSTIVSSYNRDAGVSLYSKLAVLLEKGDIRVGVTAAPDSKATRCSLRTDQPNDVEVLPCGLEGIPAGLRQLEAGVSNVKLVALPQAITC